MATVTMKAPAPAGLSNKARELMEAINTDAGKHNVWVRTQANAPAQRPWFSETSGEGSGQVATGRVAGAQIKHLPHMLKWNEYNGYLKQISEIAAKADVSPIEFADRQSILLLNPGLNGRLQVTNPSRRASSEPRDPAQKRRLHRRRGRARHGELRRPHPDPERHLARPRQQFRGAGD